MTEEELVREVHEMAAQSPPPADPKTDDQIIKLLMVRGMAEDAEAFLRGWLNNRHLEPEPDREHLEFLEMARAQFEMIIQTIRLPLRDDG